MLDGYVIRAEKAPNARGVRRVLESLGGTVLDADGFHAALREDASIAGVLITGNYPSEWVTSDLIDAIDSERFTVLIDTLPNALEVDVFLPGATWMEKAGTFENVNGQLQSFHRAVSPARWCKSEAQIATDLLARLRGDTPHAFSDAATREAMAEGGLPEMTRDVQHPPDADVQVDSDMHLIVL